MGRTCGAEEPRYEKGDRVWVLKGGAACEPGVVIGHYVDWNLYRVVYTVDLAGQGPRALEEWRLSFRKKGEERWQTGTPAGERQTQNPDRRGRQPEHADRTA